MRVLAKPLHRAGEFQREVTAALIFIRTHGRHDRGVIEHGSHREGPSWAPVGDIASRLGIGDDHYHARTPNRLTMLVIWAGLAKSGQFVLLSTLGLGIHSPLAALDHHLFTNTHDSSKLLSRRP